MIHALHGNFGLPSDWDAALPPGVPAKAWHLWEIRRRHPETHTLTGFATWFNNQIAALSPDPCRILAGYSLGGRLALHVLAERPALWHRALLLSTHPGLATHAARDARLAHDLVWRIRCLEKPWHEVCAAWNAQAVFQSRDSAPDLLPLEPWRQEIAGAFDGWSLGHGKPAARPRFAAMQGPMDGRSQRPQIQPSRTDSHRAPSRIQPPDCPSGRPSSHHRARGDHQTKSSADGPEDRRARRFGPSPGITNPILAISAAGASASLRQGHRGGAPTAQAR